MAPRRNDVITLIRDEVSGPLSNDIVLIERYPWRMQMVERSAVDLHQVLAYSWVVTMQQVRSALPY